MPLRSSDILPFLVARSVSTVKGRTKPAGTPPVSVTPEPGGVVRLKIGTDIFDFTATEALAVIGAMALALPPVQQPAPEPQEAA